MKSAGWTALPAARRNRNAGQVENGPWHSPRTAATLTGAPGPSTDLHRST